MTLHIAEQQEAATPGNTRVVDAKSPQKCGERGVVGSELCTGPVVELEGRLLSCPDLHSSQPTNLDSAAHADWLAAEEQLQAADAASMTKRSLALTTNPTDVALASALEAQIVELERELELAHAFRASYTQLAQNHVSVQHDLARAKNECAASHGHVKSLQASNIDLQEEAERLRGENADMERFVAEQTRTAADKFALSDVNKVMRLKLKEVVGDFEESVAENVRLRAELDVLRKRGANCSTTTTAEDASTSSNSTDMATLKSDYEQLFQDYERACGELDKMEAKHARLREENGILRRAQGSTTEEVAVLMKKNVEWKHGFAKLSDKMRMCGLSVDDGSLTDVEKLIDAHMALYERTAPLRQELVSGIIGDLINTAVDKSERVRNDRLIRGLNGENSQLLHEADSLRKELDAARLKLHANHTAHLITGDKDKEIARLRQHLREKEHDDLELTHFLEEERTVRAQMMADLEQKVLHLEERLQETSNALVTVQADADRLRAALLLAEQDRDDLNEVAMRLKEANYDLRAEADGLKGRLEQVTNELADVQCEKGELADYVAGYKEKTQEKITVLKDNLQKAESEVDELASLVDHCKRVLQVNGCNLEELPELSSLVELLVNGGRSGDA